MIKIERLLDIDKEYQVGDELLLKIIPFFSLEILSKSSSSLSWEEQNSLKKYEKSLDPVKLEELNEVMMKRIHIHLYRTISSIKSCSDYQIAKQYSKYEKLPLNQLIPIYIAMSDKYAKEMAKVKETADLIFKK